MSKPHLCVVAVLSTVTLLAACQVAPQPPAGRVTFAGLAGTHWRLVEFQSMDDAQGRRKPEDPAKYTITLHNDGSFTARLDCNRATGPWRSDAGAAPRGPLSIGPVAATRALCPEPSMGEFLARNLAYVRSYTVAGTQLHMALMADAGIIVWEPWPY